MQPTLADVVPPPTWRARVAATLRCWATRVDRRAVAERRGTLLRFVPAGVALGRPIYDVVSVRGNYNVGDIRWSNQWHRARFKPHPDAVFDAQCVAEIFAQMRDLEGLR